jgi:hypothetical protein
MEERRARRRHGRGLPGVVFGLLIVTAGTLMLLDNLDIVDSRYWWRLWPVALIVIGLAKFGSAIGSGGRLWGGILIAAGGTLLASNFDYLPVRASAVIWPMIIIAFGVHMLLRAIGRRRDQAPSDAPSHLSEWAVFGGTKRQCSAQDFEGGECIAVFGGVEIDLRKAAMQKDQVTVDANAMFGGVEMKVPETWTVTVKGVGIFGGYEDKTIQPVNVERRQHLIVTGYAIFGGVTVQH